MPDELTHAKLGQVRELQELTAASDTRDYLHVAVGAVDAWSADDVRGYLCGREWNAIKFLCVNDLPEVERSFPDARLWIEEAISRSGAV